MTFETARRASVPGGAGVDAGSSRRPAAAAEVGWEEARAWSYGCGSEHPAPAAEVPLWAAAGLTTAAAVPAIESVPGFDMSAMDGWAVSGVSPWIVDAPILAGDPVARSLAPGHAAPIATGAPLPRGAAAVLRRECGRTELAEAGTTILTSDAVPPEGRDIRRQAEEFAIGDIVSDAGSVLDPATLGALSATGHETVSVRRAPTVALALTGDELLRPAGSPGAVRDSLAALLGPALDQIGARHVSSTCLGDDPRRLAEWMRATEADVLLTVGGTAHGPADPVRSALAHSGARIRLDGVAVRPGHSTLVAVASDGRPIVALPGNPFAAVVDFVALVQPLVHGMLGRPVEPAVRAPFGPVPPESGRHRRVIACVFDGRSLAAVAYQGANMLRGLTTATHLAILDEPGSAVPTTASVVALPWYRGAAHPLT